MQDALGDRDGIVGLGVGQDDGELVATGAVEAVFIAGEVAHGPSHLDQHLVAGGVALAVVHDLQVVEVHERQAEGRPALFVDADLAPQLLLEGAVVAETGEPIGERDLAGFAVERLQLIA